MLCNRDSPTLTVTALDKRGRVGYIIVLKPKAEAEKRVFPSGGRQRFWQPEQEEEQEVHIKEAVRGKGGEKGTAAGTGGAKEGSSGSFYRS
jgi:hypothetical protein